MKNLKFIAGFSIFGFLLSIFKFKKYIKIFWGAFFYSAMFCPWIRNSCRGYNVCDAEICSCGKYRGYF